MRFPSIVDRAAHGGSLRLDRRGEMRGSVERYRAFVANRAGRGALDFPVNRSAGLPEGRSLALGAGREMYKRGRRIVQCLRRYATAEGFRRGRRRTAAREMPGHLPQSRLGLEAYGVRLGHQGQPDSQGHGLDGFPHLPFLSGVSGLRRRGAGPLRRSGRRSRCAVWARLLDPTVWRRRRRPAAPRCSRFRGAAVP